MVTARDDFSTRSHLGGQDRRPSQRRSERGRDNRALRYHRRSLGRVSPPRRPGARTQGRRPGDGSGEYLDRARAAAADGLKPRGQRSNDQGATARIASSKLPAPISLGAKMPRPAIHSRSPAVKAERPLSVRRRDLRRNAPQRGRCAEERTRSRGKARVTVRAFWAR